VNEKEKFPFLEPSIAVIGSRKKEIWGVLRLPLSEFAASAKRIEFVYLSSFFLAPLSEIGREGGSKPEK
jgi:hypothetical protein